MAPGGKPDPLIRPQARPDRRPGLAARRPAEGPGRGALRGRVPDGRHGLRGAGLQHDPARAASPTLDTGAARGRAGRRAGDDAPQRAAHEADAAVHDRRPRRPAATTCRSCRTTASTGTASRSRWCWPRRRSRPTTPQSLIRVTYAAEQRRSRRSRRPKAKGTEPGIVHGRAAASWRSATPRRRWPPRRHRVDVTYTHAAPQPQRDRAARGDARLGRRRAAASTTPRRRVAHMAWSLAQVFGIDEDAGARHLALRRRRLRRQDAVAAPDPGRRGVQAGRAAGAHRAVARGRVPHRRRPHA